jgi:DNA-binding response OmpR family regulator
VKKVLVVDDDSMQLHLRETVLRIAGFDVRSASSVKSALDLVHADDPGTIGLVITDHLMPDISGVEFVRQLRRLAPHMPVIVMSGLPEAESEYDGLGVAFRHKPCSPPELIALVRSCLTSAA